MSEENKTVELKEEDLGKVSGGGFHTKQYCPKCNYCFGYNASKSHYCPQCQEYVTVINKG